MNVKRLIVCGMLLGLLTAVSFAQRGRLATGGTVPGARLPNAVHTGQAGSVQIPSHTGNRTIGPNTQKIGTVQPNATPGRNTPTTAPNADTRVITPDAHDIGNRTIPPNQ